MFEIAQEMDGDWSIYVSVDARHGTARMRTISPFATKVEAAQALLKAAAEEVIHALSEAD